MWKGCKIYTDLSTSALKRYLKIEMEKYKWKLANYFNNIFISSSKFIYAYKYIL